MSHIHIAGRTISKDAPPFIIAEAGINHNGDLENAFKMIQAAKVAGADAIKFQTFKAEEFVSDRTQTFTYQSQGQEVTESMLDMFKRYEFSREAWFAIKAECDRQGILFLSTPQNRTDLDLLLEIGVPAIKVGSDDFTNLPLLASYVETGLPLIVSCGMADLAEVYTSLEVIGAFSDYPVVLLLCTSQYPTPPQDINLNKLRTLQSAFPSLLTGFSDHSQGPLASSLAVAYGACVFEKHFTLDRNLPGPDHWFSENPETLKEWVTSIRTAFSMLGSSVVRPTAAEREMRKIARRSITVLNAVPAGTVFSLENISLRRPGTGLPPSFIQNVLGRKSKNDLPAGHVVSFEDLE